MVRLTTEQFATDRIIIVAYPNGTGGKFLINSLALSRRAVLQHFSLAEFDSAQKIELLCNRYNDRQGRKWGDIGLGCVELFGVDQLPGSAIDQEYRDIIANLIKQQKYFFLVAHTLEQLAHMLTIWPNANVIHFTNSQDFMLTHRWLPLQPQLSHQVRALNNWWKNHKQSDWPSRPPYTVIEFQNPEYQRIAEHIKSIESLIVYTLSEQLNLNFQSILGPTNWNIRWDASWYLEWEQYRIHIEMLYTQLGFDDFDADKIQRLYNSWISTMQQQLYYMIDRC